MDESIKQKTVRGVMWKIAEAGGSQAIQFVISVVLARLIVPEQFAPIAILTVFISIAGVFVNSGFSTALIRTTDRTQADCCTVYYFNIVISIISYIILYCIAPAIGRFYEMPELSPILRVMSISVIIGAFGGVHQTLFRAEMNFRTPAAINIISIIISGGCGIFLAYRGFQVWALVLQFVLSSTVTAILLIVMSKWRPSWCFSFSSLRAFFDFGSKILGTGLLESIYNNIYSVVIGKFYPKSDVAFYNRAYALNSITSSVPMYVLQSVTFPALCKIQDSDEQLKLGYRKIIQISSFIVFPLCLGAGAVAYPLINTLYTNTWIACAPLLQILAFAGICSPINAINTNLLQVKGRSDLFLKVEIIKKALGIIILITTIPLGIDIMCWGYLFSSIIGIVINTHYTGKLLGLGFTTQFKDLYTSLLMSLFMFACCLFISKRLGDGIQSLAISIIAGAVIYLSCAAVFKPKAFLLLQSIYK